MSYLELRNQKKDAEDLYFSGEWAKAEAVYLSLIKHERHERQVATQNSFREKVFRCRGRLGKFKEAGDILLEMCEQIIIYEQDLLMYSIPKYLRQAYICYHLAGEITRRDEVLRHRMLTEPDRNKLLVQESSVEQLLQ